MTNTLPSGIWDNPDEQDQEAYEAFVESWFADEAQPQEVVLSAMAYHDFNETGSGGAIAGGCSPWFIQTSDEHTTTLTLPCSTDGYYDTTTSDFDSTSSTVKLGTDNGVSFYNSFFNFCGANIPQGATITEAYLTFKKTNQGTLGYSNVSIYCEDADNPTPPVSNADGASRVRTTAFENMFIFTNLWHMTSGEARCDNLIDVVQEIVDRPGFASDKITFWLDYVSGTEFAKPAYIAIGSTEGDKGVELTVTWTTETLTELNLTPDGDGYWNTGAFNNTENRISWQRAAWNSFFHFNAVALPQGSTIFLVNFEPYPAWADNSVGFGDLQFCDEDDSVEISSISDGDSRSLTTATRLIGDIGMDLNHKRKDANAKASLQEVVDRTGFATSSDLQIVVTTTNSDQAPIHSIDAVSQHPNLRILYAKFPFNESPTGGLLVGGVAHVQGTQTESPTGGCLTGGSASFGVVRSLVTASGGVVVAGLAVEQWEVHTFGGRVLAGGSGEIEYISTIAVDGGVIAVGNAYIEHGYITSGGNLVGGTSVPFGPTSAIPEGGAVLGGSAANNVIGFVHVGSGGAVISQPTFATGLTHRQTITVPSGSVASDLVLPLAVRIDVLSTGDVFIVTDANGVVLSHDVRETTATSTALFFRCELSATEDNVFNIYFNLEAE